jgi:hypothetical protein
MGDIYDVNKYTDAELYNILDLVNPSDRELEAKIFHMINKYKNMQNESGDKLANFFNNIYARFFEIVEEYDNATTGSNVVEKSDNMDTANTSTTQIVKTQDYIKGVINPLLKETITRIISIDSQYRDNKTTAMATNFTFNLSETLNNVLAIRLNSIQIPKTWYTISSSYGANFFYLKGNVPGINDGLSDYKIEVPVGNYKSDELIHTLNASISTIKSTYTDACFGTTGFSYNSNTTKATFTMDYYKTFSESNYAISFPTFSYPIDASNTKRYDSLPQILGFDTSFIPINHITTNYIDSSNNPDTEQFYINRTNSSFKIINYNGYDSSNSYHISADANYTRAMELSYNTITIDVISTVFIPDASYSRQQIVQAFNEQLQQNEYLTGAYIEKITITDTSMVGFDLANTKYYYKMVLPLNPRRNPNNVNMKTAVIFPENTSIWLGSQSCFQFETSINEISTFKSNANVPISDYSIGSDVYFTLKCNAPTYTDNSNNNANSNNIRINVANNTYSLTNYIAEINSSINRADNSFNNFFTGNSRINISSFAIDSTTNNYLRMRFYIEKKFTTSMYLFDCSTDCYFNNELKFHYNDYDLSVNSATGLSGIWSSAPTFYNLENCILFRIRPNVSLNLGNKSAAPFDISLNCEYVYNNYIPRLTLYNANANNGGGYDSNTKSFKGIDIEKLNNILNWTIQNWEDPILKNKPLNNSNISMNYDSSYNQFISYYVLTSTFDLSINNILTAKNYNLIFTDPSGTWSKYLYLDNFYDLQDWSYNYVNQYELSYTEKMGSSQIYGNLVTLYNNSNNYFYLQPNAIGVSDPTNANRIEIRIDASQNGTRYTLGDIMLKIQGEFDAYAYGSKIFKDSSNVYIRINYSRTYNTSDYRMVFYDPFSFVRCFVGASSIKNTSWDTTIGWILGFRDLTEYPLGYEYVEKDSNDNTITYYSNTRSSYTYNRSLNIATIVGDTTVSVNLYNYFMIVLNDYVQNHLNDGLVGIAPAKTVVQSSSYANRSTYTCDPVTGKEIFVGTTVNNNQNTANQIYAENQKKLSVQPQAKVYSSGPSVQDVFAIIPLNVGNIPNGSVYVETGSGLQKQERVYFGPVNISRMNIKLVTDRGDTVDLNGSDWSCTFQCDQYYQNTKI